MRIEKVVITAFIHLQRVSWLWIDTENTLNQCMFLTLATFQRSFFFFLLKLFFFKLHLKLPWDMMLGGGAPQWQIKDRIKGNRPCSAQAHTTRHTHPTCMSGVALFQVLVVARAFCRRHNVIRCLQRKRDIHTDALERLFASPQPLCSRISLLSQTFLPVLRCPYFTSVNHISVFIILYFMCFPPLQIIVFLRPPHPTSHYLSPLFSSVFHNQWPPPSPCRSTLSRLDLCRGRREAC